MVGFSKKISWWPGTRSTLLKLGEKSSSLGQKHTEDCKLVKCYDSSVNSVVVSRIKWVWPIMTVILASAEVSNYRLPSDRDLALS